MSWKPSKCDRCDGTGNELLFMYRQCSQCRGTGTICTWCGSPEPGHERKTCEGHSS